MADVSITAANVLPGIGAVTRTGTAGTTITAGKALYRKPSDGKLYLTDATTLANKANTCVGVAADGASAGQAVSYYVSGQIFIGGTVIVGVIYTGSPNAAGGIAASADTLSTGYSTTLIGLADTTSTIILVPGFLANNQLHV